MEVRVLAFATGPRRHGNSETLLDWMLGAMEEEEGVVVEKHALTEIDIGPCKGCNACEKLNRCIQEDDLPQILEEIIEADIIIIASPIYCMSICAQAKALVDRMQVLRSRKYVLKLPVVPPERKGMRLGAFLATAGQDWDYVFDASLPVIKCFYHVMDVREKDISYLMINNVDEKGAIKTHPDAQSRAEALGKEMCAEVRKRKGGN